LFIVFPDPESYSRYAQGGANKTHPADVVIDSGTRSNMGVQMKPNAFTVRRLLTILLIATGTFSVLLPVHAEEPESISIVRLLGAPEQYDGKKVQITGFMNLEFEGNAIYLSKADY